MSGHKINVHWSFWLIAILALIWSLLGSINFLVQMSPEMLANFRESERIIIETRPMWATLAFGLAVFGGTGAAFLLLLKKSVALYLFSASFIGVLVTMLHSLGSGITFGVAEIIGIILMPVVVAAFLIWYCKRCEQKGWLG